MKHRNKIDYIYRFYYELHRFNKDKTLNISLQSNGNWAMGRSFLINKIISLLLKFNVLLHYIIIKKNSENEYYELKKIDPKNIILVYDCKTSPATYGDFIDLLIFARLLISKNISVEINIINDQYHENWSINYPNKNDKEKFISELIDLSHYFLSKRIKIQQKDFNKINFKDYILFKDFIIQRKLSINKQIGFLCEIYAQVENITSEFFLNKCKPGPLENKNYVVWHIRCSTGRNIHENDRYEDLLECYNLIRSCSKIPIVIVSSKQGTSKLKLFFQNKSDIIFSKDYNNSFISDIDIILASKLYIQNGYGGMFSPVLCSTIPYIIMLSRVKDMWELKKSHIKNKQIATPWAINNQLISFDKIDFNKKLAIILKDIY